MVLLVQLHFPFILANSNLILVFQTINSMNNYDNTVSFYSKGIVCIQLTQTDEFVTKYLLCLFPVVKHGNM